MPLTETGCWIWLGSLSRIGYGSIKIDGKTTKAHRASWIAHRGEIPAGLKVLHKCDVRCCINPDHLFIGTQADNVHDMISKGRRPSFRGVLNGRSKLNAEQVREIRAASGTNVAIARQFGVGKSMVSYIRNGSYWGDV